MKKFSILLILSFSSLIVLAQSAQDKAKMERERQAIQNELKEIQGVYEKVKGQKRESLGQLNLLQKKMALQDKYIHNINREIRIISDDIYSYSLEINKLNRQLDTLKAQYARSVVYAYKNRSTYDYLNFIFSAASFNDALKRVAYLKSYRSYRQDQVANIKETQKVIEQRKQELLGKKTQKSTALQNQTQQLGILEEQKKEKADVVNKLKSKENELSQQITAKKKRDAQLKRSIAAIINREIKARRDAEAKERERLAALEKANRAADNAAVPAAPKTAAKKPAAKKEAMPLNEREVALSEGFQNNKGRLPWPVDNGYVSIHYGTYSIPGTKITGDNPGITINTPSPGASVKAVFDGEVTYVGNLGDGMMVMISHGKYFTVYSNLSGVNVGKGTQVRTGQSIGRAGVDDEGGTSEGSILFMVQVGLNEVNPEPWLRRR
jgi:septal ring factor EnvC (AmiA/AmiB activator)